MYAAAHACLAADFVWKKLTSLVLHPADSLVAAILWACITYYPVGLAPEASRFFTFVLILFVVHSMVC